MADLKHDFSDWAKRKAAPAAGDDPGLQMDGAPKGEGEPLAPPAELIRHAGMEISEGIEFLTQAQGQLEEADVAAVDEFIAQLEELGNKLKDFADSMDGGEGEAGEDEDEDEDEVPLPDGSSGE